MEKTEPTPPVLVITPKRADILQKTGDILLTQQEACAYTGWSRQYFAEHPEVPRTEAPVRYRLSDLNRIIDARTINPLPKAG